MIPRKSKVSKQVFQEAFKKSRTISSDHLLLRFHRESLSLPSRFSFVAPKTVAKKAVSRNLLKRRGYAVIRSDLKNLKKSYICLFFFKKGSGTLPFGQIKAEILFLLKKAQIKVD